MNGALHRLTIAITALLTHASVLAAPPSAKAPYEAATEFQPVNAIDKHVLARLNAKGIQPAPLCSDAVFVRRVYLDLIGTLPTLDEVRAFLRDSHADKRARLIDALFERDEFADYWALKWCDVLRVKSEFPINLWPNAVQAYHRWIRTSLAQNRPYDEFVRQMLTSSGSNFRVPPVNFYRAMQGHEPATIARAVALTFMGVRLDTWPQKKQNHLATLFSRIAFKGTAEWKEEIVYLDPAATTPLDVTFPDGTTARVSAFDDPRHAFANWLIRPQNPWFARNIVNRVWAWLLGRGIVHEPDDLRPDNPASNPELLVYLERELLEADYDLRHIYRLILNSRTYQQSCITRSDHADAARLFAYYPPRQLDAEVMIDAINAICGTGEEYESRIPEPFTHTPPDQRSIALADGSISSPFLELFGRPPRDTGFFSERNHRASDAQRLHLLNASHIQEKIQRGEHLRAMIRSARGKPGTLVETLYLTILSRPPTADEAQVATDYLRSSGLARRQALHDLVWALINTKEFLYRH